MRLHGLPTEAISAAAALEGLSCVARGTDQVLVLAPSGRTLGIVQRHREGWCWYNLPGPAGTRMAARLAAASGRVETVPAQVAMARNAQARLDGHIVRSGLSERLEPLLPGTRTRRRQVRRAPGSGANLFDWTAGGERNGARDDSPECEEVAEVRRHCRVGFDPERGNF